MNIYLFCVVAGTTLVGWIWFFISRRPEKTLMDTVTKQRTTDTYAGKVKEDSLYELATTDKNINDFFLNKGIFKSEHTEQNYHSISNEQLRKLESWHTDVRSMVDPRRRQQFTYDGYSDDLYYQLINHIRTK